jgi:multiple sugar transport system substrate-binding protein
MRKNWQQIRRKIFSKFDLLRLLGLLAIFQLTLTLTLHFNTPKVLTVLVPEDVYNAWIDSKTHPSLLKKFEDRNPGIRINLVKGPNITDGLEAAYLATFASKIPYDLVYMDIIWVQNFANQGWLLDLADRISDKEVKQFLPNDIESGRFRDGLYRIPFTADVGVLYYRKDILKENGMAPPATFDEFDQVFKKLNASYAPQKYFYLWQGKQDEGLVANFIEVLSGHGGFWFNPQTLEVGLGSDAAKEAVNFMHRTIADGVSPGVTTYDEQASIDQFKQDKHVVFLRDWSNNWKKVTENLENKVGILPVLHETRHISRSCRGGWGFGIAKDSAYPDEAWKVIQFFTSSDVQRQFVLDTGYLPSRRALFTDPAVVSKYNHFPQMLEMLNQSVSRPLTPKYDSVSRILQQGLSEALAGQSTKDPMKEVAKKTIGCLKDGEKCY